MVKFLLIATPVVRGECKRVTVEVKRYRLIRVQLHLAHVVTRTVLAKHNGLIVLSCVESTIKRGISRLGLTVRRNDIGRSQVILNGL